MGLIDRLRRTPPEEPWQPPLLGLCRCEQHIETLTQDVVPTDPPVPFAEVAAGITVTPQDAPFVLDPKTGQRRGPFHWRLDLDERVAALYDADAPAAFDDMLFIQAGVDNVLLVDERWLLLGAPDLCVSGVQAAVATALANPRVRRVGS